LAYGDIGKIALSKTSPNPYNMDMKNTKAVFLIILGSFILATGFAYAGEALDQLKAAAGNDTAAVQAMQAAGVSNTSALTTGKTKGIDLKAAIPAASAPAAAAATPEKKEPTMGEKVKKFVGDNFSQIFSAIIIGLLAFLMIGTGGAALAVGAAAFGFFYLLKTL